MLYRIEGIYGHEIIQTLKRLGVNHFGFDFRPTSFNFIQQYLFQELVSQRLSTHDWAYLHFCNEKDFVIEKIVGEIPQTQNSPANIILEFSDSLDADFYQKFNTPFIWHYRLDRNLKDLLALPALQGLVLNIALLEQAHKRGHLIDFAANLNAQISAVRPNGIPLYLTRKWDSTMLPSFSEYFYFYATSLPVDSSVEICYRKANLPRFEDYFTKLALPE